MLEDSKVKAFLFITASLLTFAVVHELTHGMIAEMYGCQVTYNWIPTGEYFFHTGFSDCSVSNRYFNYLQQTVEIVGYHAAVIHTVLTGYIGTRILNQ